MQTFLPYSDFNSSFIILDYKRLGKQRVEAKQILNILEGKTKSNAWKNHPAVLMWAGYEKSLKEYLRCCIKEWINRGYKNTMEIPVTSNSIEYPFWLGDERFHRSHRSNLLRKYPEWYSKFWNEPDDLPYIWPVRKINMGV